MSTPRRSFLGRLAALIAIGAAPSTLSAAVGGTDRPADRARGDASGARWPDERWLDDLAHREHRLIVETGIVADGLALRRVLNFLDVHNTDYQNPDARLGVAIGTHSAALSLVLGDLIWSKYAFGKRFGVKTAQGTDATANPFRAGSAASVEALSGRGVQFLACNRSLMALARGLAGPGGDATAVHAELVAGLLPQAHAVPAMVVALSRAQSRGVPYMSVA